LGRLVEARNGQTLPRPLENEDELPTEKVPNLARLPLTAVDSPDMVELTIYIGKAVLKAMFIGNDSL